MTCFGVVVIFFVRIMYVDVMLKLCVSGTIYILYIKIYKYVNIKYT